MFVTAERGQESKKNRMLNFMILTLYLLSKLTLTLILSFGYLLAVFKKLIFRRKIKQSYMELCPKYLKIRPFYVEVRTF